MSRIKIELFKFIMVGAFSTLIDFTLFFTLVQINFNTPLAKTLSFISGTCIGFFGNSLITFNHRKVSTGRYFSIYTISLILNVAANHLSYQVFQNRHFSWILATFISTSFNFIGLRSFAFADKV